MAVAIHDHAIVGDGRSAALIASDGTIDWLSWPRFDSPSILGALLDPTAGSFCMCPHGPFAVHRRYLPDTNVLETTFETASGVLVLTDFMSVASEEEKANELFSDHALVRVARCERGEVELLLRYAPRPDYGARIPRLRMDSAWGIRTEIGGALLTLRTDVPCRETAKGTIEGALRLRAGDEARAILTFDEDEPALLPPLESGAHDAIARTRRYWQNWVSGLSYDGPARDAVIRSALVLKLLVFAPSGAVIAAPTTSLPEQLGGRLNWDYRYCWLRDSSMTVRALAGLGCTSEAEAYVSFILHSTRLTRPALAVLYDVYGRTVGDERSLEHLTGYGGSRPVRVGNAAARQLQLDVYGEVVDAVFHLASDGRTIDRETARMLDGFGRYVCRHWRDPDEGIWEPRSGRTLHTHSLLLCWTAIDRLLKLQKTRRLPESHRAELEDVRSAIRREIEEKAWRRDLSSYVARIGGDELDASLLLLPWYGFLHASAPRMKATLGAIETGLGAGRELLYRYQSTRGTEEGAFGICSFWRVDCLARGAGTLDRAARAFESLLGLANDVQLYGEEIDPSTSKALGNFPQAFTHVGLINAALSLKERAAGARRGDRATSRQEVHA